MEDGVYTKTVTVIGLERFPTRMWKNIGCDHPRCDNWDKTEGNRFPESARRSAIENGWQCGEAGDFCPEHRDLPKS